MANLNADLLDGNHASAFQRRYQNVRVVAKSGGDYSDPVAAMNDVSSWCPSPTSEARCLLRIMPGTYDIGTSPLQMRAYVDIEGSGMSSTVIKGALDSPTGLVRGANATELRQVAVSNSHAGAIAIAIYNEGTSLELVHVAANVLNAEYGWAIYQWGLRQQHTHERCQGLCERQGEQLWRPVPPVVGHHDRRRHPGRRQRRQRRPCAHVEQRRLPCGAEQAARVRESYGGRKQHWNLRVQGVPVSVHGALITVGQGAPYSYGILQQDSPTTSLALRDVVVRMTAGSNGFGVFNTNTGGNVALDHSDIQAPTNSVRNDNAAKTFLVGNTRLAGLAWGTVKCVFSYNDAYNPPNSACVP